MPAVDVRLARARDLHARAVAANSAGRPTEGARLARHGLRLLVGPERIAPGGSDGDDLIVRLLATLAKSQFEQHGLVAGLAVLDEANTLAVDRRLPGLTVPIANQRGLFLLHAGDLADARAEFDRAEHAFGGAAPLDRANVLLNRSALHLQRRDLAAARRDLVRCRDVAARANLDVVEGMAVHNEGYLEFLAGNLALALGLMEQALGISDDLPLGVSYLDRARVLIEAGLTDEADATLAAARDVFVHEHTPHDAAEADLARAECALVAHRPIDAARYAGAARARFRRRGDERWRRAAELVGVEAELVRGRTGEVVRQRAARLAVELGADGLAAESRRARLDEAELLLCAGRADEASAIVAALRARRGADSISERMHARALRARLHVARADRSAARREIAAGLRDLVGYQSRFGSIDLRTASAVHGRQIAQLGLRLAVETGRPAEVLAASERGRALSSRLPPVRPPRDETTRVLLAHLRQTVEEQRAAADQSAARALAGQRAELEQRIRARAWAVSGHGAALDVVSPGRLRVALNAENVTLVSYVQNGRQLLAVHVDGRRSRLMALGSAEPVAECVRRVRADLDVLAISGVPPALRVAAEASLARSLARLDELVLAPLRLGGTGLVVVPTGPLSGVPWGLLPRLRGVPVTVTPSATSWSHAVAGAADATSSRAVVRRPGPRVVALAGPDLLRAAAEVRGVVAAWPGTTRATGRSARGTALVDAMDSATIVHVAAHGSHHRENPLFSSLRLADGAFFAHELRRSADHVVLSACELGVATVRPGDEALGLTTVLLHLGARSVISGVARVADDVAADVMVRYHRQLAAGRTSAQALAQSVDDVDGVAPFVCFGSAWTAPVAA